MSLKKILMKGTTRMSLHERFTFLRNQSHSGELPQRVNLQAVRQGLFHDRQQASIKSRRLAQAMERRPSVMAALKLKKNILKQRLGQVQRLSVKDRLSIRGRGGIRGRIGQRGVTTGRSPLVRQTRPLGNRGGRPGGRGNLNRSQSLSNLSRSQSIQSLNGRKLTYSGGRGRGGFQPRNTYNRQEFRRGGLRGGLQSRGGGFIRNRDDFRNKRGGRGRFNNRGFRSRGFRSRGGGRGRGGNRPLPTKEELDLQLDQYMAGSRGALDRELDTYMNQQESWD